MTSKFTAHLGNDAVIKVKFYESDAGVAVAPGSEVVAYNLDRVQDVVVELVNRFNKRVALSHRVEDNTLVIELNIDDQRLGNYYLDIRFNVPNPALRDGLQAHRFRVDGVEIVEAREVSGKVIATLDEGEVDAGPARAELQARIEVLEGEKRAAEAAALAANEAKATAEATVAEKQRAIDAANERISTLEAELEESRKKEGDPAAAARVEELEQELDRVRSEKAQLEEAKAAVEQERDAANTAKATAEQERDAANSAKATAEQERDAANTAKVTAEQERDAANSAKVTAEQERDAANTAKAAAEATAQEATAAKTALEQQLQGVRNYFAKKGDISNDIVTRIADREFSRDEGGEIKNGGGYYTLSAVKTVGAYAFKNQFFEKITLHAAEVVKKGAFAAAFGNIQEIHLPSLKTAEKGAFEHLSPSTKLFVSESFFDHILTLDSVKRSEMFSIDPSKYEGEMSIYIYSVETNRFHRIVEYRDPPYEDYA